MPGEGGAFIVEPPIIGSYDQRDSDLIVEHSPESTALLGTSFVTGHSVDGDPWDDLVIADASLGSTSSDGNVWPGGFYVFRGGPPGF